VVNLGCEAGCSYGFKANVLIQLKRETIRTDSTMEGDEHLPLLGVPDTLDCPDQPCPLWHQELLMIVGVVVRGEHDEDRPGQAAIDVICDDTLKNRAFEHPIESALIAIEVVRSHRLRLCCGLGLLLLGKPRRLGLGGGDGFP